MPSFSPCPLPPVTGGLQVKSHRSHFRPFQTQAPSSFFFPIYFYLLEANYFIILQWVLSYIDMNQPWIYMCSPSRSPLPPPSPSHPSGSSQCTRPEHLSHASNLGWRSVSPQIIYMFRCCSLETSHPRLLPESKILFCTCVSFSVLHIGLSLTSF